MAEEIKKIKEEVQEIEEKSDFRFILERQGKTSDHIFSALITVIIAWAVSVAVIVAGFLLYLNQYDYTSTQSYEANGIYALIDSEGNIIAQDISPEIWDNFTEWWKVYGEGKSNDNEGAN